MMIASTQFATAAAMIAPPRRAICAWAAKLPPFLTAAAVASAGLSGGAQALEPSAAEPPMKARIEALIPDLESYIASGMKAFDVPGLAIGIVSGDRLVYAKGFGVRGKSNAEPVDSRTVFQIGSPTKGFLATTMAMMVDRGKLNWDDRIVDLDPDFQLKDPWVTREFRVNDLIAQRSGLPSYANDILGLLGYDEAALIRSLRQVEPVSSFRSTFAYTNVTHLLTGRLIAKVAGAPDWNDVARRELIDPLGMAETSFTAEAIKAAANHADGHRWTPGRTIEVPFDSLFPYGFGAAGNINSTVEDMARWLRLQLGNGSFEGRRFASSKNLAAIRTPKVAISDKTSYAMGWEVMQTANGSVIGHNGGTGGFGAYVGFLRDKDAGVVVLTNAENVGMPDAIGEWTLDRLLGNPPVDHAAESLKKATAKYAAEDKIYAKPASPRPFPPLPPLSGSFAGPTLGKAAVRVNGEALMLELQTTGAELKLEPWDGDVFTLRLMPSDRFAAAAENMGELPAGFAQFQMDPEGKPNLLCLSFDGQIHELNREVGNAAPEGSAPAPAATPLSHGAPGLRRPHPGHPVARKRDGDPSAGLRPATLPVPRRDQLRPALLR
jgi:CubicO group peptidase (beta-lactamase class C family)